MKFVDNFSNDGNENFVDVFFQPKTPVFQNKLYKTIGEAKQAVTSSVRLVQSKNSGFVYNKDFDPGIMNYDENYNNEQSSSSAFQSHLLGVLDQLIEFGIKEKKVVEVGCGKGVFFEMMLKHGIDCTGFDPTYEGNNPKVIKDYFSEKYNGINAEVIIMRHTLEHIPQPFSFLHTIAKANNYSGKIFIEVPTFDWIEKKKAFWDVFYEHCNYFTEKSLGCMFSNAVTGSFFSGQYIYLWADLADLRDNIPQQNDIHFFDTSLFADQLNRYKDFLNNNLSLAIWGAGAKGSTFLNLLDADARSVKYVIDINTNKVNKFIAVTGHKVVSPDYLLVDPIKNILVMNENYFDEIETITGKLNIELTTL